MNDECDGALTPLPKEGIGVAERWQCTLENIERLINGMREDCEGITSEERVALDDCSRRLSEVGKMIRWRQRAKALGANPCPECGGDTMVCIETGIDLWRPYVECQVCGARIKASDLGVMDSVLPNNKFLKVEDAMVKAWNARGGERIEEDRDQRR